jgi:uncharacterized protein (TIGR02266 family)
VGDKDSIFEELESLVAEAESSAPDPPGPVAEPELASSAAALPTLVAEFVPLNRRRVRGDPPLAVAELERWMELRELLEYTFGSGNPPLAGSRRRQLRVPSHLKVRTRGRGDSVANLHDISAGGAFIETSEVLDPGTPLKLEIDPGDGEASLQLDAMVRWGRDIANMDGPAGVGVEFQDIDDDVFDAIERLVERALGDAGHREP